MKVKFLLTVGVLGLAAFGCNDKKKDEQVISQRYVHKYGYSVNKEEWESRTYPGQVITLLKTGVTVTSTYENGVLHGPCTHTFPHSMTVEHYYVYSQGNLVKEIHYDIKGMPLMERVQFSPTRYTLTQWYSEGSPLSIEEFANEELLEGQYFNTNNETEGRVEKGNGYRVRRDQFGVLLSKDVIEAGYMVKREAFYSNGTPESVTHFSKGNLHGEKRIFAQNGEPNFIEEYVNGKLHGKCTYFKNGTKEYELSYLYGLKNSLEVHFIDGLQILEEICWENDKLHGPSTFYVDGVAQTLWYYDGREVSERKYEENIRLDEMITHIADDVRVQGTR